MENNDKFSKRALIALLVLIIIGIFVAIFGASGIVILLYIAVPALVGGGIIALVMSIFK